MHNRRPARRPARRPSGRRRVSKGRKGKPAYLPVVVILCLSVGCGYATAKYVVEPAVNYVPQLTAQEEKVKETEPEPQTKTEEATKVVEDEVKVKQEEKVIGYAVQLGCFSGRASAKAAMGNYNMEGLQVVEQNKMYKIIGKVYNSKEEAKKELEGMADDVKSSAFVATIHE